MGEYSSFLKYVQLCDENVILTKDEEIMILKHLEVLYKKDIQLYYLNQEIAHLLLHITLDLSTIEKLKEINFLDFATMAKDISTPRKIKIYSQFVQFLYTEFSIPQKEISLQSHHIEELEKKENATALTFDETLFIKQDDFNYQKDLDEKLKTFNVTCLSNYTKPSGKIGVKNFVLYFNQRLNYFTELLSSRISLDNVVRVQQLKDLWDTNTQVSLIGLVSDIAQTKNGHYMITLEDKSGQIKCFVNKDNKELIEQVKLLCLDEGIGIVGKVGNKIIWSDEIITPAPANTTTVKKIQDEESYVVCISDLHFGAHVFQDEAFSKFLDFINSNTTNEKLNAIAKKIKYVLIPGDLIEGIGIYPGQGQDARILSTEKQYHEVARWLCQIPKHIGIVIIPGNHDTDRLSEPQPPLPYDKAYAVYNMENALLFSNPSRVTIFNNDSSGGLECYSYHGGSYFYYANEIQSLREKGGAKVPEEIVKYLLEKRHIAPTHGATLYIPDVEEDPLIIKKMPDLFLTGHTHKLSVANYKGCTICSCGCWVEMSEYQEKMGMYPDVGKCILINCKTRKLQILNFYTEEYKKKHSS